MKFCSQCGAPVAMRVPEGDSLPRHCCDACGTVHYRNPKIVVGCIPEWEDRILLCRRAIEPRYGLWTLPAGFMENGETTQQGAARETLEEANARVEVQGLHGMFNLPHISQVYLLFRSRLLDLDFGAGAESLEAKLMSECEIPWGEIAFPVINEALRLYFRDRRARDFRVHCADILRQPGVGRGYSMRIHSPGEG